MGYRVPCGWFPSGCASEAEQWNWETERVVCRVRIRFAVTDAVTVRPPRCVKVRPLQKVAMAWVKTGAGSFPRGDQNGRRWRRRPRRLPGRWR